jgi:hypothetical protein
MLHIKIHYNPYSKHRLLPVMEWGLGWGGAATIECLEARLGLGHHQASQPIRPLWKVRQYGMMIVNRGMGTLEC